MVWYPPYWEDPDSEEEEEYQWAADDAVGIAEERYPGHGVEVFASSRKRQLSEAIPRTERSNGKEDDAVRGDSDARAVPCRSTATRIPKEVPNISKYGRKRTAKMRH
jgi:hypothetical protein